MMRAACLFLAVLGCRHEAAAIIVSDSAPGPQIVFVNCEHPDTLLPLGRLEVKQTSGLAQAYECRLEVTSNAGLVGGWRYGQAVPGYTLTGCPALRPGETYEVFATLQYMPTRARFRAEQDGRLTMMSAGCH